MTNTPSESEEIQNVRRSYDLPRSGWGWYASWGPDSSAKVTLASDRLRVGPRTQAPNGVRQLPARTRWGRIGQFSALGIIAALCIVIGFLIVKQDQREVVAYGSQLVPAQSAEGTHEVLFILPLLDASNVSVAGDFSAWEPVSLSDENGDGIWQVGILLVPGRYEYAFIIDGRWWGYDSLADGYVRSFGEYNSVRYVGGGGGV